jgi:hypothetical protein
MDIKSTILNIITFEKRKGILLLKSLDITRKEKRYSKEESSSVGES